MRKIIFSIIGIVAIGGLATGIYLWNKPHKNMQRAAADLTVAATDLMAAFKNDENAANAKYLDKVVAVSGKVRETTTNGGVTVISLDAADDFGSITCELDQRSEQSRTTFSPGESITLKGMCAGNNGIDVVLVRCVLVE